MLSINTLSPGQTLGRYELLASVARGGMGQVWVGRLKGARGFQKLVAIKTLLAGYCEEARVERMLLEEARIAALIHHPNVVQTIELGEQGEQLYLVMEWIDGESLSFILKRLEERGPAPMPMPVAVNLIAQACSGLHAAHELTNEVGVPLGVVHRDVSPHNLLVTHAGVVKIVDFGIAKATNQNLSSTEAGEVKGKFSYMAPEQILCEPVDRRADIFALGIVLYSMTTGRHPFRDDTKASALHSITSDEPAPPPSTFLPGYPRALEAVVMRALEKSPERRFPSGEAMRVALQDAMPQAFDARFDDHVRAYLKEVMGDRATARHEGLRRLLLAADERDLANASANGPQPASQSVGSFRAVIIDGGMPSIPLPGAVPAPERKADTVRPRGVGRALAVLSALAGIALVTVVGARKLAEQPDASGPTPAAAARAPLPASAPEVSSPSSIATSLPSVLAAAAPPALPIAPSAEPPPAAARTGASSVATPARPSGASNGGPGGKTPVKTSRSKQKAAELDLMVPEFAR